MKNFKYLILFIAFAIVSCKNANQIKKRELAKKSVIVHIEKAIKPSNIGSIKKISVNEFEKLNNEGKFILVDVRTLEEFADGYIKGAININFKKRTFPDYINVIAKDKPVAVYCRSANRSGKAAIIMQSLGFKKIYDLDGGIKAWKKSGKNFIKENNVANKKVQEILAQKKFKGTAIVGKSNQVGVEIFEKLLKEGKVTLVDVRTAKEYASGHIKGAINIDWKNRHFADNALANITDEKPVAIYCRSGNRATRAMFAMGALGFKEVYNLKYGIKSWNKANKPLKTLEVKGDIRHLDVSNFNNAIAGQVGTLIDVRTPKEYNNAHIPGAIMIDYKNNSFKTELTKLDRKVPLLIYCRSGGRSGRAMKVLEGMGFKVYNLDNGFNQWKSEGMKLEGNNLHTSDGGEEGC